MHHPSAADDTHRGTCPRAGSRPRRVPPLCLPLAFLLVLLLVLLAGGCAQRQTVIVPPQQQSPPAQTPERARTVIATARSLLGVPYRAGGFAPRSGFDCSGFIWWVYQQNGITLPRTTAEQAEAGVPVPGNALRPADILVFRTGSGMHGLHTGVYTGNGFFIHSPKPGSTVREETLAIAYWQRNFIAARRVIAP